MLQSPSRRGLERVLGSSPNATHSGCVVRTTIAGAFPMRVFQVEDDWSIEHVRLGTRPDPQPGAGHVRLWMRASALNYRDLLVPQRGYGSRMKALPLIMLSDGVGLVDAVGEGVVHLKAGDRVCP